MDSKWLFEDIAFQKGYSTIAGVDEAGRGPLAGPVVAAACILQQSSDVSGINDSKKISSVKRKELYKRITEDPSFTYAVGIVSEKVIDEVNIHQATLLAMLQALEGLKLKPDYVLVDGGAKLKWGNIFVESVIGGDEKSFSIAAASIIAKECRDKIMIEEYHLKWPMYGFDSHKGYGTAKHREILRLKGPCSGHRETFEPIKSMLQPII